MRPRDIYLGTAIALFAAGVSAEGTRGNTVPDSTPASPKARAEVEYRTARDACEAKPGAEKTQCMKDAKAKYDDASKNASGDAAKSTTRKSSY